jgi:hypothetical protein
MRDNRQIHQQTSPSWNINNPTTKKRSRKGSKYVDYDAFVEFVMAQIRTVLPPLTVQEPQLGRGYVPSTVTSIFGAGDLTPFASRIKSHSNHNNYSNYSASAIKVDRNGLLKGSPHLTGVSDYYNTRPFGDVRTTSDSQTSIIVEVPYLKWLRYSVYRYFNRFITRECS